MNKLPVPARIYVLTMIGLGAVLLIDFFPRDLWQHAGLFVLLLLISSVTSVFKVNLPLSRRSSTMS